MTDAAEEYPIPPDIDPVAQALLNDYLGSTRPEVVLRDPKGSPEGRAILESAAPTRLNVLHAALAWLAWVARQSPGEEPEAEVESSPYQCQANDVYALVQALAGRAMPYTPDDIARLLARFVDTGRTPAFDYEHLPPTGVAGVLLKHLEKDAGERELSPETRANLERLRDGLKAIEFYGGYGKSAARVEAILSAAPAGMAVSGEAWADTMGRDISAAPEPLRSAWKALLAHAPVANRSEPSDKWVARAKTLLAAVGTAEFCRRLPEWLNLVGRGADARIPDRNGDYLKGLLWYCAQVEDVGVCRALTSTAEACFRRLPGGSGLYSSRAGQAALYALQRMPGKEPVAQLVRLKVRVKSPWGLEEIEKALTVAREREGLTEVEVEELTLPTYGLDAESRLCESFGEFTVEVTLGGPEGTEWTWRAADGSTRKNVPASVRTAHGEALKAFRRTVIDAEKMLAAQRDRLERLLASDRSWPLPVWRERYLEHPLVSPLARRLIWQFELGAGQTLGICQNGGLVGVEGQPLPEMPDTTHVRLWHPLGAAPEEVLRWRVWLEAHEVTQPFKQAHREVYVLTYAERSTGTHSNRFAMHVLRQHVLAALCRQRGWNYEFLGSWDGGGEGATLDLPQWGLQAEYWLGYIESQRKEDYAESGVALYVTTDQVRFSRKDTLVNLADVPAHVFSEVMRDVDLFVAVSSIAADPEWRLRGEEADHQEYWEQVSFGELPISAVTRREVLERLLPRLKIRDRCRLEGRFLVVQGELRTYKIHLSSGNILMAPNDQYLCIVPDRVALAKGTGGTLFLPFEGDSTLSQILSKAFLLAADNEITDPSIVNQILGRCPPRR